MTPKNILFISYDCNPSTASPVAAIRTMRFVKYLLRRGCNITVVTRNRPEEADKELKKVRYVEIPLVETGLIGRVGAKINPQLEPAWFDAVKYEMEARKKLEGVRVDIIISSSPPESSHLIGAWLKTKLGKPWIADLRDLWSHDHYRNFPPWRRELIRLLEEKGALKKADRIITVSDDWGKCLKKQYGARVSVITNSIDTELHDEVKKVKQDKFRIAYLGKLNAEHQDITPFLKAIKTLVDRSKISQDRLEASFYVLGYGKPDITAAANRLGLSGVVREHKPVPFKKAVEIMKNSGLLLVVGWNKGLSIKGWRPQKVYEYIGSGTPVLLINGSENEELREVVKEVGCVADNASEIEEEILRQYKRFEKNGINENSYDPALIKRYEAANATNRLYEIMEEMGKKK